MRRLMSGSYAPVVALGVAIALAPAFVSNQYYLTVLVLIALHTLLAIGLNLLIGYAGILSLALTAFYGLGAYAYALTTTHWEAPPLVGLACAVVANVLLAYLVGIPTTRLHSHYLAIATLGLAVIFVALAVEMADLTGGPNGILGIPALGIGSLQVQSPQANYYLIWAVALLAIAGSHTLIYSRVGRAIRAMKTRETAADILGVDVARLKLAVFVLSAVVAGVGGVLYASFVSFISPETFGFHLTIQLLVILAIGGMGTVWGPIFGSFVTMVTNELLRPVKEFSPLIYGLVLILFILFTPSGVSGWLQRWRRERAREDRAA